MSDPVHPATAQTPAADQERLANATPEAYQELQQAYEHFNRELFEGQLPGCLITLHRDRKTMSYFSPTRFGSRRGQLSDEISLNPTYFGTLSVSQVMQALVHEMVHQWQAHRGDPGRGRYHNKEFADKMESIGLIPSSTGKPGGQRTGESMNDYPQDGGPFEQAVAKLEATGYSLSWFDRFITAEQAQSLPTAQAGEGAQGHNQQAPAAEAGAAPMDPPVSEDRLPPAAVPALREKMTVLSVPAEAPNRSNRLKYVCLCGRNFQGSPNDMDDIHCGRCKAEFAPVMTRRSGDQVMAARAPGGTGDAASAGSVSGAENPPWEDSASASATGTTDTVLDAFSRAASRGDQKSGPESV